MALGSPGNGSESGVAFDVDSTSLDVPVAKKRLNGWYPLVKEIQFVCLIFSDNTKFI